MARFDVSPASSVAHTGTSQGEHPKFQLEAETQSLCQVLLVSRDHKR